MSLTRRAMLVSGQFASRVDGVNVLISAPMFDEPAGWRAAIHAELPIVRLWHEGEIADDGVDILIADDHSALAGRSFARISAILSLSAGVDHLVATNAIPAVRIIRLLTPEHRQLMREYVVYHVLRSQTNFRAAERQRQWQWLQPSVPLAGRKALVLGMGFLGRPCAIALRDLGLSVTGWSRTVRRIPGIETISGETSLTNALRDTEFLVCLLPLTPLTRGIVGPQQLRILPKYAFVINASRSACVDQAELVKMLRDGALAGAVIDVCDQEPLSASDPIWDTPNLAITPHCAAVPPPVAYLPTIIDALRRILASEMPVNVVDTILGY